MNEYVPQVGDIVCGENQHCNGIYVGQRAYSRRTGDGLHYYVMAENGDSCTFCEKVSRPPSYWATNYRNDMEGDAARVLFGICESFAADPGAAAKAYGYRDPAAQKAMPPELDAWWTKWRAQLTRSAFRDACIEMSKAFEAIATIQKLDGEPSVALQERLDAATFKIDRYREKIIDLHREQIRRAQETHKLTITV